MPHEGPLSQNELVRRVADELALEFLRRGQYSASAGPVDLGHGVAASAAAASYVEATAGFAGLAVQSVGVEQGVNTPMIHLYLTHGTQRQLRELPKEVGGVQVRPHKIGAINVRPDAANRVKSKAFVFERKGRICCGSSCGPTSEDSTGTLGALVRNASDNALYLLSNNHVFAGCNHVPFHLTGHGV
jgi:hypothetical protein